MNRFHRVFRAAFVLVALSLVFSGCARQQPVDADIARAPAVTETRLPTTDPRAYDDAALQESRIREADRYDRVPGAAEIAAALERVHFEFDAYTLSSRAQEILTRNAAYLRANPEVKVLIEGHTDERGSDEYNLALGERRAQAVRNFLISLGIAPERLSVISYGEELPMDPASNEEAWAKNRRAEFKPVL
ncbi:peptidoglycan-associated lipoprotein Pal [Geoalkalibacter halelectricus]|uniref:Peptidoglycan-associated lipoprotein n=1 Tax=Geoalkalibacter halelectricus TaxID=2847045 RepID=A0ABY5ZFT7_9BACT|nr:peptidoglycan-associated lipoprotein Pal [Geoalkalibacter halelectricus]MDO3378183.1 peptidoglycan-associated lipoprotein Pal [Geoalkalibacter halelectricus]UWZ78028.1 peptidoglycan-associated lipoprotein Pal [Geoalkalibacter halelectricus]